MNGWRQEQVLNPALQSYNPNRQLPPNPYVLPPVLELAVVEALWKSLFNNSLEINDVIIFNTNSHLKNPGSLCPRISQMPSS